MFCINNKRGLAELVSSVLIILIVISAISIFFAGYLKNSAISLSPEISCTELRINPPIEIKEACFNSDDKEVKVSLERNLDDFNIDSAQFILTQDNLREEWSCGNICGSCTLPSPGEKRVLTITNLNKLDYPQNIIFSIDSCTLQTSSITPCE